MLLQPSGNPLLDGAIGILNIATVRRAADDGFKRRARCQIDIEAGIEQIAMNELQMTSRSSPS